MSPKVGKASRKGPGKKRSVSYPVFILNSFGNAIDQVNSLFPHCRIFWHPFQQFIFRQTDPPFLRHSSPPAPFPPHRAHRSCGLASHPVAVLVAVRTPRLGGAPPRRAPPSCPVVQYRCGRARCLTAGPPGSRRRAIGAVRGLASRAPLLHPPPLHPLNSRRHLPTRITRAARWGHRALPSLHPRITHAIFARAPCPRITHAPLARALRTRPLPARRRAASPVTARHPRPHRTPSKSPVAARHPADSCPLCSYTTRSNALCAPLY